MLYRVIAILLAIAITTGWPERAVGYVDVGPYLERLEAGNAVLYNSGARRTPQERLELFLRLFGKDLVLELHPSAVLATDAKVVRVTDDGVFEAPAENKLYQGVVRGRADSSVAVTFMDNALDGTIRLGEEVYLLGPAVRYDPDAGPGEMVALRAIAAELGLPDLRSGEPRATGNLGILEITVVADFEYFETHGANASAQMQSIMNQVDGTYVDVFNTSLRVIEAIVFETPNDPFLTSGLQSLLSELGDWSVEQGGNVEAAGVVHLFTDRFRTSPFFGAGVAFIDSLCDPERGVSISFTRHPEYTGLHPLIVKHELGHSFGASHDGDPQGSCPNSGQFIMSPTAQDTVFSDCSIAVIEADRDAALCIFPETCRDGILDPGEECDDGNDVSCDACSSHCTVPRCGDFVTCSPETCDDGNAISEDGCDATCSIEFCGDGIVQSGLGEQCDDGQESVACDTDCTFAVCGDGELNLTAGEVCDESDNGAGEGYCTDGCSGVQLCGNGVIEGAEECDDGGGSALCDTDCTSAECRDGIVNGLAGEKCDDGNSGDGDGCTANCEVRAATRSALRCQRTIATASRKFLRTVLRVLQNCQKGVMRGSLSPTTNCRILFSPTEPEAIEEILEKLNRAGGKLTNDLSATCHSQELDHFGFPGVCGGPTPFTLDDLDSCITNRLFELARSLLSREYPDLSGIVEQPDRGCIDRIARTSLRLLNGELRERQKCHERKARFSPLLNCRAEITPYGTGTGDNAVDDRISKFHDRFRSLTTTGRCRRANTDQVVDEQCLGLSTIGDLLECIFFTHRFATMSFILEHSYPGGIEACGNGVVEIGEECDDHGFRDRSDNDGCIGICRVARCGDGSLCSAPVSCTSGPAGSVEECDDGNTIDGDGCSSGCAIEP